MTTSYLSTCTLLKPSESIHNLTEVVQAVTLKYHRDTLLLFSPSSSIVFHMEYDLLITNVMLVDGYWDFPYKGSVLIRDGIIEIVSGCRIRQEAKEELDGKGLYLIPGIIDMHTHSDLPLASSSQFSHKILQGITTEVIGNCGAGSFPMNSAPEILGSSVSFPSVHEYIAAFNSSPPASHAFILQAHAPLRRSVLGEDASRAATEEDIEKMCTLLKDALEGGAKGFSTGLYYNPCSFADEKELLALLQVVADYDALFSVHIREEGDGVLASLAEVIVLARMKHVRLQISHLKAIGEKNQHRVPAMLEMIERAHEKGLRVHFDQYPYTWGVTSLSSLLPPRVLALSDQAMRDELSDPEKRTTIIEEMEHPEGYESLVHLVGFDEIRIISHKTRKESELKSITEIARQWNVDPYDALFTLLLASDGTALISDVTQSRESLEMIMRHPLGTFCTDAIYSGEHLHPRCTSAVTDLLRDFYRKKEVLTLPEHVKRMSSRPAAILGLEKRGIIRNGFAADLVLLDIPKEGEITIEMVMVGGKIAVQRGIHREEYTTEVL